MAKGFEDEYSVVITVPQCPIKRRMYIQPSRQKRREIDYGILHKMCYKTVLRMTKSKSAKDSRTFTHTKCFVTRNSLKHDALRN